MPPQPMKPIFKFAIPNPPNDQNSLVCALPSD